MTRKLPAAANLEGLSVGSGWKVEKYLPRKVGQTGGNFSFAYLVSKGPDRGFMKAFDFSAAFETPDVLVQLQNLTTAYNYEKDILIHCKEKRLKSVVIAVEYGDVLVPNYDQMSGRVFFLIFELADGDVRGQAHEDQRFDILWSAKVIRGVTLGLYQLHNNKIAHQDVKPSNVLLFKGSSRVADFGRASRRGYPALHDELQIAGDRTYAPPEQLYGHIHPDFTTCRFGCDMYMLGTLIAFLLTGINMKSHLFSYLDTEFHYNNWGGTYHDVLPYLERAFADVMRDVNAEIDMDVIPEAADWIKELCNPDLAKRGHPRGVGKLNQYSLQRYETMSLQLVRLVELRLRTRRRVG